MVGLRFEHPGLGRLEGGPVCWEIHSQKWSGHVRDREYRAQEISAYPSSKREVVKGFKRFFIFKYILRK